MSIFYIHSNAILQNALSEIRTIQADGGTPKVSVSDKKESRSSKQNRLMHKWFSDIANSTGHGIEYEAGRCKITYFLPVMRISEKEEARQAAEIIDLVKQARGFEYICRALGASAIESTRTLSVKEFAHAMNALHESEYEHALTEPQMLGVEL